MPEASERDSASSERPSHHLEMTPGPTSGVQPRMAVVLAAGRSERLRAVTGGGSKALVQLGGLKLVERAVRGLLNMGIGEVVVVVGYHAGPVGAVVSRLKPGRVNAVLAHDWELGNGSSLAAAEEFMHEQDLFVVITVDHVFGEGTLHNLVRAGEQLEVQPGGSRSETEPPSQGLVAGEEEPAFEPAGIEFEPEFLDCFLNRRIERPSRERVVLRVRIRGERAVAFGKHIDEPAIDCGAFLLPSEAFESQREAAAEGDHTLSGAVSRLAAYRRLRAVPITDRMWWQDIDTPKDLRKARSQLRRSLVKDGDGPVSRYLNRPVSTRISMALAPVRPSPDLISLVSVGLALVAAWLLATSRGILGGIVIYAASVLDGVDGETARLFMRAGPRGAMLDGVLDRVGDAAVMAGLGVWALSGGSGSSAELITWLTVAATAGSLLSMASKDRATALGLPPAPERQLGYLLGGRDGRLLLVAVCSILGRPTLALITVTVTSAVSLALRLRIVRR